MAQPPTSGRGPGEEPARDSGSPGSDAAGPDGQPPASNRPAREPGPGGSASAPAAQPFAMSQDYFFDSDSTAIRVRGRFAVGMPAPLKAARKITVAGAAATGLPGTARESHGGKR